MTMQIETTVTGNQLGRLLAQDPEELGYALDAMRETMNSDLAVYANDLVLAHGSNVADLITFLRAFADAMQAAYDR